MPVEFLSYFRSFGKRESSTQAITWVLAVQQKAEGEVWRSFRRKKGFLRQSSLRGVRHWVKRLWSLTREEGLFGFPKALKCGENTRGEVSYSKFGTKAVPLLFRAENFWLLRFGQDGTALGLLRYGVLFHDLELLRGAGPTGGRLWKAGVVVLMPRRGEFSGLRSENHCGEQ